MITTLTILMHVFCASAQQPADTTAIGLKVQEMKEISITGVRSLKGMGHLNDVVDGIIYAGKKTEVLLLDSIDANTAQSNPRQLLGRLPGAVFSETEGSGFPSNGIGFRGVSPVQSIETNTRQNGYNISSDLFGYNEAYYLPTLEAVDRIEVIRGAASLQFGPLTILLNKHPQIRFLNLIPSRLPEALVFLIRLTALAAPIKISAIMFLEITAQLPAGGLTLITGSLPVLRACNINLMTSLNWVLNIQPCKTAYTWPVDLMTRNLMPTQGHRTEHVTG